jgi:hypothetical protein
LIERYLIGMEERFLFSSEGIFGRNSVHQSFILNVKTEGMMCFTRILHAYKHACIDEIKVDYLLLLEPWKVLESSSTIVA